MRRPAPGASNSGRVREARPIRGGWPSARALRRALAIGSAFAPAGRVKVHLAKRGRTGSSSASARARCRGESDSSDRIVRRQANLCGTFRPYRGTRGV